MKILITIILIAISPSLYAQITVNGKQYKKGEVVENDQIDKFQGKYVWKNGTDVFRLNLKRDTIRIISSNPFVHLNGTYEYTKNGKVVYSYAQNPKEFGSLSGMELLNDKLRIYFTDGTTGARAKGYLAFNKDSYIIWKIALNNEGIHFIGQSKEISVPTEMILEKISN